MFAKGSTAWRNDPWHFDERIHGMLQKGSVSYVDERIHGMLAKESMACWRSDLCHVDERVHDMLTKRFMAFWRKDRWNADDASADLLGWIVWKRDYSKRHIVERQRWWSYVNEERRLPCLSIFAGTYCTGSAKIKQTARYTKRISCRHQYSDTSDWEQGQPPYLQ